MYIIESVDLCNKIIMKKKTTTTKKQERLSVFRVFPVINVIICGILYFITYKTYLITNKIIFLNHQRSSTTIFVKKARMSFCKRFLKD